MYASLSVPHSLAFLQKTLAQAGPDYKDVGTLMERTSRMVAAVTLEEGQPARFSLLALGNYPSGIIGMRLSGSRDWHRETSGRSPYWQSSKLGVQVSVPNNSILLAANGDIVPLLGRYADPYPVMVPPDVSSDMESMDLVVYLPRLPGSLSRTTSSGMALPIHEVWVDAAKAPGGYTVAGTANTESEKDARLFVLVLRLGIVSWMKTQNVPNASERLKAISVVSSANQVKLTGLSLSEDEMLSVLLSLFKGGSTPPSDTEAQASE